VATPPAVVTAAARGPDVGAEAGPEKTSGTSRQRMGETVGLSCKPTPQGGIAPGGAGTLGPGESCLCEA